MLAVLTILFLAIQVLSLEHLSGGLKVDFEVVYTEKSKRDFRKGPLTLGLANQGSSYNTNLTFGSQQTEILVTLDTGSSDLWVIADTVACQLIQSGQPHDYCLGYGTFAIEDSTSFTNLSQTFAIGYGQGTWALGDLYTDHVGIEGLVLDDVTFAVATVTSTTPGILGIGLEGLESSEHLYVNFPAQLVKLGVIPKNFYSLYLDSPDSSTGSIIFGGVDDSKYSGNLTTIPLTSKNEFLVNLDYISASLPDKYDNSTYYAPLPGSVLNSAPLNSSFEAIANYSVLLDSGTTIQYLPQDTVNAIASLYINPVFDPNVGLYFVDGAPPGNLVYHFQEAKIEIPLSALLEIPYDENGNPLPGYLLDIGFGGPILGDGFLRWAYVVYDLADYEVSFAQSKFS